MKVLINLNSLRAPLTGIGYFTRSVVIGMQKCGVELKAIYFGRLITDDELIELLHPSVVAKSEKKFAFSLSAFRSFPLAYLIRDFFVGIRAAKILRGCAKDGYVYFEPGFVPMKYAGRIVSTVHDLSFLSFPEFHPPKRVRYLSSKMSQVFDVSYRILVDSNAIKEDVYKYLEVDPSKVIVNHLGVSDDFKPCTTESFGSIAGYLGLQYKGYILSVATLEPRKNITSLIDAYALLPSELREKYPLVLVGNGGWGNALVNTKLDDLLLKKQLVFTGYLNDDVLKKLYAGAKIFAYPSYYEGFGLPILEAMASGVAVLTSSAGATEEVAGESALLVDPYSISDIKKGLLRLLLDDEFRLHLEEKSYERAHVFTWDRCVKNILSSLND